MYIIDSYIEMKDNRLQARDLGRFSTISALILLMFVSEVECALSWNDYSDVLSGTFEMI